MPARRWAAAAWRACWRPAEMKSGGSGGGGALYSTRGGGAGSWRAEKSDGCGESTAATAALCFSREGRKKVKRRVVS